MPVIAIIGFQNSGKTKVIESLVHLLVKKGYRVGTVKHISHHKFVDLPGKDSFRHALAGANPVIASGSKQVAIFHSVGKEQSLSQIIDKFSQNVDLILAEGYKKTPQLPKIFVQANDQDSFNFQKKDLLAIVRTKRKPTMKNKSKEEEKDAIAPFFEISNLKGLAVLIEKQFLMKSSKA